MSAVNFVVFDSASGKILRAGHCDSADLALQANNSMAPNETALAVSQFYPPDAYYVTGSPPTQGVAARPAFAGSLDKSAIAANGADAATLSALPSGTQIALNGPHGSTSYTVTDGAFVLTTTWPGAFKVTATPPFPELPASFTVHAS